MRERWMNLNSLIKITHIGMPANSSTHSRCAKTKASMCSLSAEEAQCRRRRHEKLPIERRYLWLGGLKILFRCLLNETQLHGVISSFFSRSIKMPRRKKRVFYDFGEFAKKIDWKDWPRAVQLCFVNVFVAIWCCLELRRSKYPVNDW